ncbi:protein MAIN-LIKE 1-like [Arachis duranensis]|uniref:Protein MAIN-LIKE 1-like n=1 Tax=Arachis duranensis TaxID=130453 RepID=A0A6P4C5N5_ARADU|nr:protein MAIN-LIKE 1-like [Arachis duranensis]
MVEFKHEWPLVSTLLERWRPESHTFHLACGKMTITLHDVAYQLRLRIDGDPMSGCIEDKQSQTKWTVKLTWFLNTVCGELEKDTTEEKDATVKLHYEADRGWLPLLEDLDACGRLSWGSVVLAWMYRQICRAMEHGVRNLGGCVSLLLSCDYHHISLLRPDGFDTHRFPLVERWVQHRPDNDRGEGRLRHYRRVLNGIGMLAVEWTPYADPQLEALVSHAIAEAVYMAAVVCPLLCFAIVEWHQVDRVMRQFGGLQHIPTKPLDIDSMHGMMVDLEAAHTELFGQGDQHLVPVGVVPEDLPLYHPPAPELHQPEDGHLPELRLLVGRGRGRGRGRARGRGRRGGGEGREQGDELHWDRDPVNPQVVGQRELVGIPVPPTPWVISL